MAQGLSVALPLRIDETDGAYGLNKDIMSMAEQNIKMVILTSPGERMMIPDFGVGIRRYLFEQNTSSVAATLKERIQNQINKYVPYVNLKDVQVLSPSTISGETDKTALLVSIKYSVPAISVSDIFLTIPVRA
mgnify:CR=1 FL=1